EGVVDRQDRRVDFDVFRRARVVAGAFEHFGIRVFDLGDRVVDADEVVGDQAEHAFFAAVGQARVDDDVVLGGDRQLPGVAAVDEHVAAFGEVRVDREEGAVGAGAGAAGAVGDVDDAVRGDRPRVEDRAAGAAVGPGGDAVV